MGCVVVQLVLTIKCALSKKDYYAACPMVLHQQAIAALELFQLNRPNSKLIFVGHLILLKYSCLILKQLVLTQNFQYIKKRPKNSFSMKTSRHDNIQNSKLSCSVRLRATYRDFSNDDCFFFSLKSPQQILVVSISN